MSELQITQYDLDGKTISKISGPHWAIISNNNEIKVDIFNSNGTTETPWTLYASTTEEECIDERGIITGSTL